MVHTVFFFFYIHVTVHHNRFLYNKKKLDALISQIYFGMKLYMFRTVLLSIIRTLCTVHSAIVYVILVCRQLSSRNICSCSKAVYKPVWHIQLLSVQWIKSWWWTEELSETCRVSCQNKFVKLVHLVCFIIKEKRSILFYTLSGKRLFWNYSYVPMKHCSLQCLHPATIIKWRSKQQLV